MESNKSNAKKKHYAENPNEVKKYLFENFIKFSNREKHNHSVCPKYGEIYTCDLGLNAGSELDSVRPCIIITSDRYNEKSTVITVIPISNKEKLFFHQVEINTATVEEIESEIKGVAKLEQIRTISKGRLGRKIGKMSPKGMELINKAIEFHFSLNK